MHEKTFQDLTKEEIGKLFPIEIIPHCRNWPTLFEEEKSFIISNIESSLFLKIEHFGSTSIPGLSAKNTIDILMEVDFDEMKNRKLIDQMKDLGYEFYWQNEGSYQHMVFIKGYNTLNTKEQTYHIHAGPKDHPLWDRLLFRDYLIKNPQTAKEYELLKLQLSQSFKHDRVAYRIAKTEFVEEVTDKAKQELL